MSAAESPALAGMRNDFHRRWAALGAPQRPPAAVAEAMADLLAGRSGLALQLGVTPEIAFVAPRGIALDNSAAMIATAWPGDRETHRAVLGEWFDMPFAEGSIDAAFGDGCLSVLNWPHEGVQFMRELRRVLRPGGCLVLRCFAGPDHPETIAALAAAAEAGEIDGFGAFKLRLNMAAYALASGKPNTGAWIHTLFQRYFDDRAGLAEALRAVPSDVDTIDFYAGSASLHSYPTRGDMVALLPPGATHRFVDVGSYPLAERCPLMVVDFP